MLIDQFIKHFSDWWLVGTASSPDWGPDMWDTANAYVQEGIVGGLLAVIFFITVISRSFVAVGKARKAVEGDSKAEWSIWLLGAALFAHVVAYFGISYFDHTEIAWFALLAIISAATFPILETKPSAADGTDLALSGPLFDYPYPSPATSPRGGLVSRLRHDSPRGAQGKFAKL
jgi:hypothetical protein